MKKKAVIIGFGLFVLMILGVNSAWEQGYPDITTTVVIADSSSVSSAVVAKSRKVRLIGTQPCWIEFGSAPTADSTDMYMAANREEYFKFVSGHKVATLRADTLDGTLYITTIE